jgi:hypothetical protein
MASTAPFVSAGLQLGGSLFGASQARKSGKADRRAAYMSASVIEEEGAEEARRVKRGMDSSEGLSKALSAASGVQMSGSRKLAVDDVAAENKAQLDWLKKSTASRAKAVRAGGRVSERAFKSQSISSAISGIGKGITAFDEMGLFG